MRDCLCGMGSLVARAALGVPSGSARWRSGDAADCKSVYAGSIPARASTTYARAGIYT